MAARRGQRTVLQAHEAPSAEFAQTFKVSHSLAKGLAADRTVLKKGQVASKPNAKQASFPEVSRRVPLAPLPSIIAQQEVLSELRRDAPIQVTPAEETPAERQRREKKREEFLASRKARHEAACEAFERDMDALADSCQERAQEASSQMRGAVENSDVRLDELLHPLEGGSENLGEKTEGELQMVMDTLDKEIEARKERISDFTRDMEHIDRERRKKSEALMKVLVDKLAGAAHAVPGEQERIMEQKALSLNTALLENQKSMKVLEAQLKVQTLRKSQECKTRWHQGKQLWRGKRHLYAIEQVRLRIFSDEFREPPALLDMFERVRAQQQQVFQQRRELVAGFFDVPLAGLSLARAKGWEERSVALNDRAQEDFDALLADLKNLKDGLKTEAERMLENLCQDIEEFDARQEWGEYQQAVDLVNKELRPPLMERLGEIDALMHAVTEAFTRQDETQNSVVMKLVGLFEALGKKADLLAKETREFEVHYQGDVKDEEDKFKDSCADNEAQLKRFKEEMDELEHHDSLDALKEQAFEYLAGMVIQYREYANRVISIHTEYPDKVGMFVERQAQGFCSELGLITKQAEQEERSAKQAAAAAAAAAAEPPVKGKAPAPSPRKPDVNKPDVNKEIVEETLATWPGGESCSCEVLEKVTPAQLWARLIGSVPQAETGGAEETPLDASADAVASGGDTAPPSQLNGRPVLEDLSFEEAWLAECLGSLRVNVFERLGSVRQQLDSVDLEGQCEEVRRQLDQLLRRHTNRRGMVQVEWYVPRYSTISKHKDKFERHLIEVARKSQNQDDAIEGLTLELGEEERLYQQKLGSLQEQLPSADNLPQLTAMERQALDAAESFKKACVGVKGQFTFNATVAPERLKEGNEAFLKACEESEEGYSKKEMKFYIEQIKDVDESIEARQTARGAALKEFVDSLEARRSEPLEAFMTAYKQAHAELCASKGLGQKEGGPRRQAQERCWTLISRGATTKQHLQDLFDHLSKLCKKADSVELVDAAPTMQSCDMLPLRKFMQEHDCEWVFSSELVGSFYILVCSLNMMALHLDALKEEHAPQYRLEKIPSVCVLREAQALCTADDEHGSRREKDFMQMALERVMGPLLSAGSFGAAIQSIVDDSHEKYKSRGGTPPFMQEFLNNEMRPSAERSRQQVALAVRDLCDKLRESTLLGFGDALFGELRARSTRELLAQTARVQVETKSRWETLDESHAAHEKRLNPNLANPNAEAALRALDDAEATRHMEAKTLLESDKLRMRDALNASCSAFVCRMAARFEAVVRLIDSLPLHNHFGPLPGDEQVVPPRMSIKRRLMRVRELPSGAAIDQSGDGLPEKQWPGVPKYKLRSQLMEKPWPEDEELARVLPERLEDLLPEAPLASFRSPVHRALVEQRDAHYAAFAIEFEAEVQRRGAELMARAEKEEVGERRWQAMIRQLKGETGAVEEEPPEQPTHVEEEPPPKSPSPEPKKKGKKN